MNYHTFEIAVDAITVAYCCIDKEHNQLGYVPIEDETLSTVLRYIIDDPHLSLTVDLDNTLQLQTFQPKDELFLKALSYHLPRKYKIKNIAIQESDKSMYDFLKSLTQVVKE